MTHICVSKLTIIGSDNGLSPRQHQAIIWTNAGILLIETLGTNFSEILIRIQIFFILENALEIVVCEMASTTYIHCLDWKCHHNLSYTYSTWRLHWFNSNFILPCVQVFSYETECTGRCHYYVVTFLPNSHKIHTIAHPLGRAMVCIWWVQMLIDTLPQSQQRCMQHHVLLESVIMALNCILFHS